MRPSFFTSLRSCYQLANRVFSHSSQTHSNSLITPPSQEANTIFRSLSANILTNFHNAAKENDLPQNSLEYGHRIVAVKTTLLNRLSQSVGLLFHDKVSDFVTNNGQEKFTNRIAENQTYIRFTTHPTEGQNLKAILRKDSIVKINTILAKTLKDRTVLSEDVAELAGIAAEAGINNSIMAEAKSFGLPTLTIFTSLCNDLSKKITDEFVTNPIHHVTKMTVQDERDLLLYHMDRCKKDVAEIAAQNPDLISVDDIKFSSWAFDMDGKPHVQPGNGTIFEFQSQQKFFQSLLTMLETFANKLDLESPDESEFRRSVIERISTIQQNSASTLFSENIGQETEAKILLILDEYKVNHQEEIGDSFAEIINYVKSSNCKTAQNGFSTREEIDKTNAAIAEINEVCHPATSKKVAEYFGTLSPQTQRQVMCLMESALLHQNHEHIISQFDCELSSFKNTLQLFEIAKELPQYHATIPYFREYYSAKSIEAGFDLYAQLFAPSLIDSAKQSQVQISPLAEDSTTIPKLIGFTEEMLADPECVAYIKKSGGIVRQTRSNSDGSSSLGAHNVVVSYLEADIAIKKMVEAAGFKFSVLQGIGANDLERMAPWRLELLQNEFTSQGSDAQHQTRDRLVNMLLKEPDKSPEQLTALKEKYTKGQIDEMLDFYYQAHLNSEFSAQITMNGKEVFVGNLTHRGLIPAAAVKELGKLSSRPDNRKGNTETAALRENDYDVWDAAVYNNDMRRIGAISLQRISSLSTFSLAPFFQAHPSNPQMLHDFAQIPLIENINMSAIFALGVSDLKSFALVNGLDLRSEKITSETIEKTNLEYQKFLQIKSDSGLETAMNFASEKGFGDPEGMRCAHACYQISGCKNVLRNAVTPLIHNSSPEIKAAAEAVFAKAEGGETVKKYDTLVIEICNVLNQDPQISLETRRTLACVAQQTANVHRKGNYCNTRAQLIEDAHDASKNGDQTKFDESCSWLAIITRSAGNPVSPGRKINEMLPYFDASIKNPVIEMETLFNQENSKPKTDENLRNTGIYR